MIVFNEIDFLPQSVPVLLSYTDQAVFVDQGSTDGSFQYLQSVIRPQDVILHVDWRLLYREGFASLRNIGARMCRGDWIETVDADEILISECRGQMRAVLSEASANVLKVNLSQFVYDQNIETIWWPDIAKLATAKEIVGHRRIYRRSEGIGWKGYLHEEIWEGDTNAFTTASESSLKYWHLTEYRRRQDNELKNRRYAWMLVKAFENPVLQIGTNHWWFTEYVPQHIDHLRRWASDFKNYLTVRGYAD